MNERRTLVQPAKARAAPPKAPTAAPVKTSSGQRLVPAPAKIIPHPTLQAAPKVAHTATPATRSAPSAAKAIVTAQARPETLTAAVERMLGQGYSVQQVEGQIHRWHPGWSAFRIRGDALHDEMPTSPRVAYEPKLAPRYAPSSSARIVTTHRPETLVAAVSRMLGQGYSVQQVEGQIHRWHPGWSASRIRRDVVLAETPTPKVTHEPKPATRYAPSGASEVAATQARPETLTAAVERMLGQGYSVQQVEGQIRRWHPGWSASRIREDVLNAEVPRWSVGRGAGQGRPAIQLIPYYRGQKPEFTLGIPIYRNPQWSPRISEIATVGLSPGQLAYMRAEQRLNADPLQEIVRAARGALKLGEIAGEEAYRHSDYIAAGLTIAGLVAAGVLAPEAVLPAILLNGGDLFSVVAGVRAATGRDYVSSVLDFSSVGASKLVDLELREARSLDNFATGSRREYHALAAAIEQERKPITSVELRRALNRVIGAQRSARVSSEALRRAAALVRVISLILSSGAFLPENPRHR